VHERALKAGREPEILRPIVCPVMRLIVGISGTVVAVEMWAFSGTVVAVEMCVTTS